jgi:hypothetical protein
MRTRGEYRRWMLLHPRAGGQLDQRARHPARRRGALHAPVHGAGAAMAMEDAVVLGACATLRTAVRESLQEYQTCAGSCARSRVQVSANHLVGMIFHVPDGLEREIRNDIYRGALPRVTTMRSSGMFTAPDYVRGFSSVRHFVHPKIATTRFRSTTS